VNNVIDFSTDKQLCISDAYAKAIGQVERLALQSERKPSGRFLASKKYLASDNV